MSGFRVEGVLQTNIRVQGRQMDLSLLFNPTRSSSRTRTRGLRMGRIGRVRMVWVWFVLDPMALQTDRHRAKMVLSTLFLSSFAPDIIKIICLMSTRQQLKPCFCDVLRQILAVHIHVPPFLDQQRPLLAQIRTFDKGNSIERKKGKV